MQPMQPKRMQNKGRSNRASAIRTMKTMILEWHPNVHSIARQHPLRATGTPKNASSRSRSHRAQKHEEPCINETHAS